MGTQLAENRPFKRPKSETDSLHINSDRFAQYYFTAISNLFSRKVSSYVRANYQIGLGEWRILANLAREPDIPASKISQNNVMDKGQVSRAMKSLQTKGLVEVIEKGDKSRNNPARLTKKGVATHRAILPFIEARYDEMMDGLTEDEVEQLFEILQKLLRNIESF